MGGTRRPDNPATPTARRYTGQIEDAALGLYFYNARQFDPALGRFLQADTIVPSPSDPQSLNRHAYALNNPLRYTDPSGHMPDSQIAEALGYANVEELYASKLWKMWTNERLGDAYWLKVLAAVQSGDRLSASERVGGLLFQVVDGKMRIFGENGATSTNLWDWQGAGFYTIDRPGSDDRSDVVFSDSMFGITSDQSNPFYSARTIPQYRYSADANIISVAWVGIGLLERRPQFQFSGVINVACGQAAPGVDFGVDFVMALLGPIPLLGPYLTGFAIGKATIDLGVSVYQTFADPVYKYKMSP